MGALVGDERWIGTEVGLVADESVALFITGKEFINDDMILTLKINGLINIRFLVVIIKV